MPWIRADELKEGMRTGGGLEVHAITRHIGFHYVTWRKPGERKKRDPIQYFPDQEFDIRHTGEDKKEVAHMAQRVEILVESDLSGDGGAETVSFGLDGTNYEIDLTEKEQAKFRKVMAEYVGAARQVKGGKRGKASAAQSGPSAKVIRAWAAENGVECPERGRIPSEVREAYQQAS